VLDLLRWLDVAANANRLRRGRGRGRRFRNTARDAADDAAGETAVDTADLAFEARFDARLWLDLAGRFHRGGGRIHFNRRWRFPPRMATAMRSIA